VTRLTLRVDFSDGLRLGPGKARLLELIEQHGSISAAGRGMGMSYRRAWLLIDSLNRGFKEPLVTTRPGGRGGGGAELSSFGRMVVETYRAMESEAAAAVRTRLHGLEQVRAEKGPQPAGS
jgi:molybdate transport system regulatory protein